MGLVEISDLGLGTATNWIELCQSWKTGLGMESRFGKHLGKRNEENCCAEYAKRGPEDQGGNKKSNLCLRFQFIRKLVAELTFLQTILLMSRVTNPVTV